jgi:predicted amidohydrolase YtcJ
MMLGTFSKCPGSRCALKGHRLENRHDIGWRNASSAAMDAFFSLAALAAEVTRLDFSRNLFLPCRNKSGIWALPSCRNNSGTRVLLWKSGPLGARQLLRVGTGFSPWIAIIFITSLVMSQPQPALPKADAIYIHGNIYTGLAGASSFHEVQRAQALAVRGDRILAVGSEADILKLKGPATTVLDLQGHFVMPGFNDAHMHLVEAGFKQLTVNLTGVRSIEEFRERVRQQVERAAPTEWITGFGWDETLWRPADLPTRWDIDEVTTEHPVFLKRTDGHVAVANTLALKMSHLSADTKDPNGGEIVRDATGAPNGVLRETAQDLVGSAVPAPTPEKLRQAIEAALQDIARSGVTSVQDFSDGSAQGDWPDFKTFERLGQEGKLTVRISEWLPFAEPVEVLQQRRSAHPQSDPMLHTGMLKAFMDGSLGSRTAAMLQPYADDDPKNSGLPQYDQDKVNAMARERLAAGFQLGFHAIGDRGVQMALDAFAEAEKAAREKGVRAADGTEDYRLRVEHAQVTNPAQVLRFKELKVIASMQPCHLLTDMHWAESRLGPQRASHSYAWAEFLTHGVRMAFGTDYPVEPVSPFRGLYAAVTRKSVDQKQEYYPAQKLTIEQAIAAYTTGSAYAEFAEKEKGTLGPGMFADFIVLDRDLTAIPPEKLLDTRVLRTVVGGKTVYESN